MSSLKGARVPAGGGPHLKPFEPVTMPIRTEPIGSIPRPSPLTEARVLGTIPASDVLGGLA
jgi:hypothetical protein